jgi:hypothetical protein
LLFPLWPNPKEGQHETDVLPARGGLGCSDWRNDCEVCGIMIDFKTIKKGDPVKVVGTCRLIRRVKELEAELKVAKAFHKVAVQQRDQLQSRIEALGGSDE